MQQRLAWKSRIDLILGCPKDPMTIKEHHKNQNPKCCWVYKTCANIFILPLETEFRFAKKKVCVSLIWLSCECGCPFLHSCNTDVASKASQHENTSPLRLKVMTTLSATTEAGTVSVLWEGNMKLWFVEASDNCGAVTKRWGRIFDHNRRPHFSKDDVWTLRWLECLYSSARSQTWACMWGCCVPYCVDQLVVQCAHISVIA